MKIKEIAGFPQKEIHSHNSIPGYFDGLDEGCCICIKNQALDQIGNLEVGLSEEKVRDIVIGSRVHRYFRSDMILRSKTLEKCKKLTKEHTNDLVTDICTSDVLEVRE